jgi:hypothetical protein
MNTNEASLGRSTVQTYSSREKRAFDGVLFSMECTARWLENACDHMQAASEIRLAMAELNNCIADCEVIADAGSESGPPNGAMRKDAVTREQVIEWGKLAGFETSLQRERNLERLGDFAIFARMDFAKHPALTAEKVASEAVAWFIADDNGEVYRATGYEHERDQWRAVGHAAFPLYAAPQPAQANVALTDSDLEKLYWTAMNNAADILRYMDEARAILASQPAAGGEA